MSETFFIGDTHFGHTNILTYEPIARPFASVEEMNEAIVDRWNSVVGKFDKVYHLGDFAFGKDNIAIAQRLNGQKRLILGNHDCYPMEEYLKYFKSVHGCMFVNEFLLTHIPTHPNSLLHRAKLNCHGHYHSKYVLNEDGTKDRRFFNVSCETNNLSPISMDEIVKYSKGLESEKILHTVDTRTENLG